MTPYAMPIPVRIAARTVKRRMYNPPCPLYMRPVVITIVAFDVLQSEVNENESIMKFLRITTEQKSKH